MQQLSNMTDYGIGVIADGCSRLACFVQKEARTLDQGIMLCQLHQIAVGSPAVNMEMAGSLGHPSFTHTPRQIISWESRGLFDPIQQGAAGRGYNQPARLSLHFPPLHLILLSSLFFCQCIVMDRVLVAEFQRFLFFDQDLALEMHHKPQSVVTWNDALIVMLSGKKSNCYRQIKCRIWVRMSLIQVFTHERYSQIITGCITVLTAYLFACS